MRQELELETEEAWFLVPKHAPNPVSDPAEEWGAKGASKETVATSGGEQQDRRHFGGEQRGLSSSNLGGSGQPRKKGLALARNPTSRVCSARGEGGTNLTANVNFITVRQERELHHRSPGA